MKQIKMKTLIFRIINYIKLMGLNVSRSNPVRAISNDHI